MISAPDRMLLPAYMLDPKYAGKSILSGAEINKAYGVITTMCHLGLNEGKILEFGEVYFQARALGWRCNMAVVPTFLVSHLMEGTLWLFPLLPPSSSESHQHQPPQSVTGPCLGTPTHPPTHQSSQQADQYKGLKNWWPSGQI